MRSHVRIVSAIRYIVSDMKTRRCRVRTRAGTSGVSAAAGCRMLVETDIEVAKRRAKISAVIADASSKVGGGSVAFR